MREGVLYTVLFLLILSAGAALILPRLMDGAEESATSGSGTEAREPESTSASGSDTPGSAQTSQVAKRLFPVSATALPSGIDVTVVGAGGDLLGPLAPVVGATVDQAPADPADPSPRITVTATAPRIAFGAAGHEWVHVPVQALVPGLRVELPEAAPPIVVRVYEPDGSPAADVPVRVEPASPLGMLRTDAGGTLVIDHAPAGLVTVGLTTAERAGPALRLRAGVDRTAEATLEPAWQVTGRVLDGGGRAVGGATVEAFAPSGLSLAPSGLWGRVVTTDATGHFVWRGRPTVACALRIRRAGYAERAIETAPAAQGPLETDVGDILLTDAPLTVVCRVESLVPEGGLAFVEVEPQVAAVIEELLGPGTALDRPRRLPLPADGVVRFDDLPATVPLRVSVRGAGVPTDALVAGEPGTTHELTLRPTPGHVLGGVLRNADGEPLSGVRILASRLPRDGDRVQPGDVELITGVGGIFQRFGLPGRDYYLRAYVPGSRSLLRRVTLPIEEPLALDLEAALSDAERRVEGVVVDEAGTPLPGVTVRVAGVVATTDADGRFRLDGVESLAPIVTLAFGYEPGAMPGSAPHPGPFVARALFDVSPGARALELVLPRSAAVGFRALDGIDGTPLTFVHVVLRSDVGRVLFDRGVALRDGRFEVGGLPARDGPVVLPRQRLADGTELVVPLSSTTVRVGIVARKRRAMRSANIDGSGRRDLGDVHLPHGMLITGRVIRKGGEPIVGARVAGMDAGWQSRGSDPMNEREMLFRTATTDARGAFVVEGFDPKRRADLAIWAPGLAPDAKRVILPAFTDELEATCEVTLSPGGHLLFVLQDAGTHGPIAGAVMDAEHARHGADYLDLLRAGAFAGFVGSTREWQDASTLLLFGQREPGAYSIGPLRPGPYEMWIERLGYEPLRKRVTVFERGENVFDIYSGTSRTVQGDSARMIFMMQGVGGR